MSSLDFDVQVAYAGFALDAKASVALTGITAVFGQSGSGKTTLLRTLAGLERLASGRIAFAGETWLDDDPRSLRPAHARAIGYVFQDARLFSHLDVRGNLAYAARRIRGREGPGLETVVAALDLQPLMSRQPATLSGGERQRVALARALLTAPRMVLMDEPLASVDGRRKRDILPYIERLPRDFSIPVLYVTHAIDEVAALADDMLLMSSGRIAAAGPVAETLSRLDLFPLTGRFETGAVLKVRVTGHDVRDHLSEVAFDGGQLVIPLTRAAIGSDIRIRIRARDVVLATAAVEGLSANNVLGGVVTGVRADAGTYLDVAIACGSAQLIARITHRSARRLSIEPGQSVSVVIKSITIDSPAGRS